MEKIKETYTGAMVALLLPPGTADEIALSCPGSLPPSDLHVTLIMLGDSTMLSSDDRRIIELAIKETASNWGPITGDINGVGVFLPSESDGKEALYQNFDAVGLPGLRQELINRLKLHGFDPQENHGYTPHITLAYIDPGIALDAWGKKISGVSMGSLWLCWGDERVAFPLYGSRVKHLRGRHDQKSHGYRGTTGIDKATRRHLNNFMGEATRRGMGSEKAKDELQKAIITVRSDERRAVGATGESVDFFKKQIADGEARVKALKLAVSLLQAREKPAAKKPAAVKPSEMPKYTDPDKGSDSEVYRGYSVLDMHKSRAVLSSMLAKDKKAGNVERAARIKKRIEVIDDWIKYRYESGTRKERLKHLRGRHDQKLHGNRGPAAGSGRIISTADAATTPSAGGSATEADVLNISTRMVAAGRTMTEGRIKYMRAYLDWKNAGKEGKAPDPKTFGDDVPRAGNHIRRAIETSKSLVSKPGDKSTPPETKREPSKFMDPLTEKTISDYVESRMTGKGWAATPAKMDYARAYIAYINGGRKGDEPAIPEKIKGTARFIRNEVDGHAVIRGIDGILGTPKKEPPKAEPPEAPKPAPKPKAEAPKPEPAPAPKIAPEPAPRDYTPYPDDAYAIHRDFHSESGWKDWLAGLTPGEIKAMKDYVGRVGEGYVAKAEEMNATLRAGGFDPSRRPGTTSLVKNLDNATGKGKLHKDTILYRSIDYSKMYYGASDGTYKVGGVFDDKGFASTSPKIGTSTGGRFLRGSTPVVMRIKAPKGSKGAYLSWNELDNPYMHESEFLLPRNSKYKIDKMGYETIRGKRVAVYDLTLME